jgi:hypothetical protein
LFAEMALLSANNSVFKIKSYFKMYSYTSLPFLDSFIHVCTRNSAGDLA